jgi:sugar transferase (PEP-CTERM system associated)
VVRIFNVYYPLRTLILMGGEAVLVMASFALAVVVAFGPQDAQLILLDEQGYLKIAGIAGIALLCIYYFDLYDLQRLRTPGETYVRLLLVLGSLSFLLAALVWTWPDLRVGGPATAGRGIFLGGLSILTLALLAWRASYNWMLRQPWLRERVYVLGTGQRAQQLVEALRNRAELGMDVVGWAGAIGNGSLTRESLGAYLISLWQTKQMDRVIVALNDRRGMMPVDELLQLRVRGVKIEDAATMLEKITGKIEVDDLNPSWLIFSGGFRLTPFFLFMRRALAKMISLVLLTLVLPLIPLIILAIKLTSPGPALYSQKRVGIHGEVFNCFKFRTMRPDAEADTGPTWAGDDDPRITAIGKWLRTTRLDEIPQLWNVLRGDMGFVGPRPERPEFVEWLSKEIPFYQLRHLIRPGITGWAQVSYDYGASLEQAKEKLRYDLYYIKNISLSFDLYIVFQTAKIVLFGRGAK